jgi:hypothetical protein
VPHHSQILLAKNGQVCHSNDQGMPVLPVGQCPQTCPASASCYSGTPPPFRPHVVLVGLIPPYCGHMYLHCDRQDFMVARGNSLSSIIAADCARALFASWISHFEVPAIITSDRGAQFTSALWAALFNLHNISHSSTTACYPKLKGLVEWFHRWLKNALTPCRPGPLPLIVQPSSMGDVRYSCCFP